MISRELNINNAEEILNNFEKLAAAAYSNYHDQEIVSAYFRAYEEIKEHGDDHRCRYLELKYIHEEKKWIYLNTLAQLLVRQGKRTLAFMCLVESLRINSKQKDVYELAQRIMKDAKPKFPNELRENKYTVSVITCTKGDRICELKESITSVLRQTFQDFELIIINDGGSDSVKDVIDSFNSPKIKYCRLGKNHGPAKARNEAILKAEGKYIAYLDDDDVYYPDHLEELVKVMRQGRYNIAYTSTRYVNGIMEKGIFKELYAGEIRDQVFDKNILLKYVYITTCSVMYEKKIIKEEGLINEDLPISEDWDFLLRCASKYCFKHIEKITVEYRKRSDNCTSVDSVQASFLGNLVCMYHLFYMGKISFIKYCIENKQKAKSYPLYEEIRSNYYKHFKKADIIEELIDIALHFNDGKFLALLSKDYFQIDVRGCLKKIKERRSIYMFLGIVPQLPLRIVKSVCGRSVNYSRHILKNIVKNKDCK